MKFAVFSEPMGQDCYDMLNLQEIEVVEAEDKDDAIRNSEMADMMGFHIWVHQVKHNVPLGYHENLEEEDFVEE